MIAHFQRLNAWLRILLVLIRSGNHPSVRPDLIQRFQ